MTLKHHVPDPPATWEPKAILRVWIARSKACGRKRRGFVLILEDTQRRVQAALQGNDLHQAGLIAETAIANGQSHEMLFSLAAFRRQQFGR